MASLEAAVNYMINLCNDDTHGYDQANRWGPDYDCASSILVSLRDGGGFDIGGATYTGNMASELCARGWQQLPVSTPKQRGDICLNHANHVELYIGNNQLAGFHSNEFGGIVGGTPGDQTGNEGSIGAYYDYPWDCILRYGGADTGSVYITRFVPL